MSKSERLLQIHHLKPAKGSRKTKMRVGRGDGSKGKTAGRGTKGTKARSSVSPAFEGGQMPIHMRLPKLHGFKNPFKKEYQTLSIEKLERKFPNGGTVKINNLVEKGLVRKNKLVKLLADGDTKQKFTIEINKASKKAVEKIKKVGGSIEFIDNVVKTKKEKKNG